MKSSFCLLAKKPNHPYDFCTPPLNHFSSVGRPWISSRSPKTREGMFQSFKLFFLHALEYYNAQLSVISRWNSSAICDLEPQQLNSNPPFVTYPNTREPHSTCEHVTTHSFPKSPLCCSSQLHILYDDVPLCYSLKLFS